MAKLFSSYSLLRGDRMDLSYKDVMNFKMIRKAIYGYLQVKYNKCTVKYKYIWFKKYIKSC